MRLSQNRFCKKFLGILFLGERVHMDIHDEPKNKITTKFAAKDRFCDSLTTLLKAGFERSLLLFSLGDSIPQSLILLNYEVGQHHYLYKPQCSRQLVGWG